MPNKASLTLLIMEMDFQQTKRLPAHDDTTRMQWFADAKLGIFIRWGIYSVKGIDESWSLFNGYTSHENYLSQPKGSPPHVRTLRSGPN